MATFSKVIDGEYLQSDIEKMETSEVMSLCLILQYVHRGQAEIIRHERADKLLCINAIKKFIERVDKGEFVNMYEPFKNILNSVEHEKYE